MIIDIIGTGLTAECYDWQRDSYKWSVSSFYEVYTDKVDLYFSLHVGQVLGLDNEITLSAFPIDDIKKTFDSDYFTSSIAYMIAYAIYTGAKEINIYGVDMEQDSEYRYQRPCLAYWLGFAKAKGIKTTVSTVLADPPFNYGYDMERQNNFVKVLEHRAESSKQKALKLSDSIKTDDQRAKEQWLGSYHAYLKIIDLIRG